MIFVVLTFTKENEVKESKSANVKKSIQYRRYKWIDIVNIGREEN